MCFTEKLHIRKYCLSKKQNETAESDIGIGSYGINQK